MKPDLFISASRSSCERSTTSLKNGMWRQMVSLLLVPALLLPSSPQIVSAPATHQARPPRRVEGGDPVSLPHVAGPRLTTAGATTFFTTQALAEPEITGAINPLAGQKEKVEINVLGGHAALPSAALQSGNADDFETLVRSINKEYKDRFWKATGSPAIGRDEGMGISGLVMWENPPEMLSDPTPALDCSRVILWNKATRKAVLVHALNRSSPGFALNLLQEAMSRLGMDSSDTNEIQHDLQILIVRPALQASSFEDDTSAATVRYFEEAIDAMGWNRFKTDSDQAWGRDAQVRFLSAEGLLCSIHPKLRTIERIIRLSDGKVFQPFKPAATAHEPEILKVVREQLPEAQRNPKALKNLTGLIIRAFYVQSVDMPVGTRDSLVQTLADLQFIWENRTLTIVTDVLGVMKTPAIRRYEVANDVLHSWNGEAEGWVFEFFRAWDAYEPEVPANFLIGQISRMQFSDMAHNQIADLVVDFGQRNSKQIMKPLIAARNQATRPAVAALLEDLIRRIAGTNAANYNLAKQLLSEDRHHKEWTWPLLRVIEENPIQGPHLPRVVNKKSQNKGYKRPDSRSAPEVHRSSTRENLGRFRGRRLEDIFEEDDEFIDEPDPIGLSPLWPKKFIRWLEDDRRWSGKNIVRVLGSPEELIYNGIGISGVAWFLQSQLDWSRGWAVGLGVVVRTLWFLIDHFRSEKGWTWLLRQSAHWGLGGEKNLRWEMADVRSLNPVTGELVSRKPTEDDFIVLSFLSILMAFIYAESVIFFHGWIAILLGMAVTGALHGFLYNGWLAPRWKTALGISGKGNDSPPASQNCSESEKLGGAA